MLCHPMGVDLFWKEFLMHEAIAGRVQEIAVNHPQGNGLTVVPITGPSHSEPPYQLLDPETLPFVKVTEISEAGSVPELCVHNDLDLRIFLMDGQELIG